MKQVMPTLNFLSSHTFHFILKMKEFKTINNLIGWLVFGVAAFVFLSTMEETGSFWDCGEFIAAAYKLQVGHPPGASLFLMMGRIASLFAFGNVEKVALMINALSAIASAFAVLFLFWTISLLMRKFILPDQNGHYSLEKKLIILGSSAVGALAYTFTDSFWFSAVEGEVYATSQFFTALVFWAMLKWDSVADEPHADRWIILIAYLMGLSIGIHLLNLLCIPALALIYYFRKYTPSRRGIITALLAGAGILAIIQYGIIAGFVRIGAHFDLFFVNKLGLPIWSGFLFFILLLAVGIVYGLLYTHWNNRPLLNTVILCFAFILIGYSSYTMTVIRSLANPPMDENDPEHAFNLLGYINREQYGDRPLLYGQHFTARVIDQKKGPMSYTVVDGKYKPTGNKIIPVYEPDKCTFFPRMYSREANHVSAYKEWTGIKGNATPTMMQNLKFFFNYQIGFMYLRYFMWNFAGRQNDLQGHGNILKGNWLSGIKGIDALRLGPQDKLPESMTRNKAYNRFYFLPLILGLIGMFYHFKRDRHDASIVMLLFIMTGLAIIVYLNQTPYQPRERDYAYAGSTYAFAIWIGMSVAAMNQWLAQKIHRHIAVALALVAAMLAGPVLLAREGWDDHDRSHRFTSRDFASNYLNSVAPYGTLFTNGDNDTFPLWYAQDVEGIRTDVRVINLSLLNTDWYIDQMKRKAYESPPVPFTWRHDQYVQGTRDYIPFVDRNLTGYRDLRSVMEFILSDHPAAKVSLGGELVNYYPTKKFFIPVDKEAVIRNRVVPPEMESQIVDTIFFEIEKNYLMKNELMILDLIAHNDWSRPIYFAITVGSESYLNLDEYFQLEGLAFRFVPIYNPRTNDGQIGQVNSTVMYDNMMNKFKWGNMQDERVYLDQNNLNMTMNFRNNFARLAETLIEEGKKDSAFQVLQYCLEVMPDKTVPYNIFMIRIIDALYACADNPAADTLQTDTAAVASTRSRKAVELANQIVRRMAEIHENDLEYYFSLKGTRFFPQVEREMSQALAVLNELARQARVNGQTALSDSLQTRYSTLEKRLYN
jgi:hypothetical protein